MENPTGSADFILSFLAMSSALCTRTADRTILIGDDHFVYEIDSRGQNLHFTDKATGRDYLESGSVSKCASIVSQGKREDITGLSLAQDRLRMEFGSSGVVAEVGMRQAPDRVTFKVLSVTGPAESLSFLNVPLTLEGMPDEPFAACALSMNLFTHVRQIPALQTDLWAACYRRFGLEGAEITLLGLPQEKMLPVIRDVMSQAKDIPYSDKGGAWALMQKEGYGSYLMNFGTLTEETVDEWIGMCRSLGFNQIDNHGGGEFFRFGDFELNREKWPDGWESFKRINDRLHQAGISSIFHTYAFFIDKNSNYVTPGPKRRPGIFRLFTLKEPLDATSDEIVVNESTAEISTIMGFLVGNRVSLRIGERADRFYRGDPNSPLQVHGMPTGRPGTKPAATRQMRKHFTSANVRQVCSGARNGPFDEIARRTAEIVNQCGFDGIYLDAIDGSGILGGEENFWYYGTKFVFAVAKHLKRPVGMEMSSMSHHWWHYRSRWQAWDRPVRGYKRFEDIHLAAIKSPRLFLPPKIRSNENEHGIWRGHTPSSIDMHR